MQPVKSLIPVSLVLLAVAAAGCEKQPAPVAAPAAVPPKKAKLKQRQYDYDTVVINRDTEVPEGFRGDVSQLLHADQSLEVSAHWKPTLKEEKRGGIQLGIIDNAKAPDYSIPEDIIALLTESTAAQEHATHSAHDFSAFLPTEVEDVGQMWSIDPEQVAPFLRQFHPGVSTTFDTYHQPYGRRPGPAGAFGILRAVSPRYLDILFRVHAELVLSEGRILYTPACFLGRLLVDREAGTVDFFQARVPTDRGVNLNITLTFQLPERPRKEVTNIVFEQVDPMELVGGSDERIAGIAWEEALDPEDACERLKKAFYKFMDIGWVPTEKVLELAQAANKPILAMVLTSPLDDQSC